MSASIAMIVSAPAAVYCAGTEDAAVGIDHSFVMGFVAAAPLVLLGRPQD